jgi:S-adenosylmethionine/arginine decarboxylase-like enzyme
MTNQMTYDQEVMARFAAEQPWGVACSVDLKNCDPDKIRDAEFIKQFVVDLCDLIDMKRFGECVVIHFGEDPRVNGFSMTQLIETSLISGHFANDSNAAYLDIFSCKEYPPHKTAEFCKERFGADEYALNVVFRY